MQRPPRPWPPRPPGRRQTSFRKRPVRPSEAEADLEAEKHKTDQTHLVSRLSFRPVIDVPLLYRVLDNSFLRVTLLYLNLLDHNNTSELLVPNNQSNLVSNVI